MSKSDKPLPAEGRFEGRIAFQQALRDALAALAHGDHREVWLCDHDFAQWPLGERQVVDAFNHWALATQHGRCVLAAAHFEAFSRAHPRWVEWRQVWSHRVHCLQAPDELAADLPSALLIPGLLEVELIDQDHCRGLVSRDPLRWAALKERIDAISQRSSESFPPTTLGL